MISLYGHLLGLEFSRFSKFCPLPSVSLKKTLSVTSDEKITKNVCIAITKPIKIICLGLRLICSNGTPHASIMPTRHCRRREAKTDVSVSLTVCADGRLLKESIKPFTENQLIRTATFRHLWDSLMRPLDFFCSSRIGHLQF